jgi:phosphatidate cytidylyltransferase
MNNLTKRTISGIAFVIVFVGCILLGRSTFFCLFLIITALALDEYNKLVNKHGLANINSTVNTIAGIYLFFATSFLLQGAVGPRIFLPYVLSLLYLMISELYLKQSHPVANWIYAFGGQMYVALPLALINLLAFYGGSGYSPMLPLAVFVFIWINDTGAYCVGSLLYKRFPAKLFERISPKKTWIGSIGGAFFVLLGAYLISLMSDILPVIHWMGLGLTVCVFGTWGDLVESLFKRTLEIKDSGHFLPGHGGVLDRFDSALIAIPASVIYIYAIASL